MGVATITLGDQWRNQYLFGMTLVHILMHHDIRLVPREEPTPTGLINILRDIVGGDYIPAKYFKSGISLPAPYIDQPPSLNPKAEYMLISLNALTARGQFVSIKTGGVVFEDPIWALLSAYELRGTRHPKIAVPKANDNQDLWHRVRLVAEAIGQNNYHPQAFFGDIEGFIPPAMTPIFATINISGDQLTSLRTRGVQALKVHVPPKFYELFEHN